MRIVERLGQQNEFVTNALVKVTPWSTRSLRTFGIDQSVSQRWSSVRMRTMFGCLVPAGGGGGCGAAIRWWWCDGPAAARSTTTTIPAATSATAPIVTATATISRLAKLAGTGGAAYAGPMWHR